MFKFFLLFCIVLSFPLWGVQSFQEMLEALELAEYWDRKLKEPFPITFNHLLSTGYFTTPSARMNQAGSIGIGFASVPPYFLLNACMQPFECLELTANYRIFRNVIEPGLTKHGFGDYADRGANFKFSFFTPEEFCYQFPGVAFGIDDFIGTKKFRTYYLVATQVMPKYGIELSFGWGTGRYTGGPTWGFFAGGNWFPFLEGNKWLSSLCFSAEVDPTHYKSSKQEPHPDGRTSNFPINFGIKYKLGELLEFSSCCLRGQVLASGVSLHYNWGACRGFFPKIGDPLFYCAPVNYEPLGESRSEHFMGQEMAYAFEEQGFQIRKIWISSDLDKTLWISLINQRYRQEHIVRERIAYLLAALTPRNVPKVIVIIESYGVTCQQYTFERSLLLDYAEHLIGPYEFDLLTPRQEAHHPTDTSSHCIFNKRYDLWKGSISPRLETFLGSAKGKFKYDFGLKANMEGFLPQNLFYEIQTSYTVFSTVKDVADFDLYNPSQLPNVATDYVSYRQKNAFSWDRLYLQKSLNWGKGFYSRVAAGYFQVNYGGLGGEMLWYPANSNFAIGIEGAVVKKRKYTGFGFQSKLRQFSGHQPTFVSYSFLTQYFLDLYFDFPKVKMFTKIGFGQFLARDKGAKLVVTRYFDNGVRLTGWLTMTDAADFLHGEKYYDRGVAVEVPIDFFFKCSSRRVWNYASAAWLRDAGYATSTGKPLFEIINRERRF